MYKKSVKGTSQLSIQGTYSGRVNTKVPSTDVSDTHLKQYFSLFPSLSPVNFKDKKRRHSLVTQHRSRFNK